MPEEKQRFGRLLKSYGDFGELRRQKKAPHTEVFYIPVKYHVLGALGASNYNEDLRSIQNCTSDQITEHIRYLGKNLEAGNIQQASAELILDLLYAELGKRVAK